MAAPSQTSPNQASQTTGDQPSRDVPLPKTDDDATEPTPTVGLKDPPLAAVPLPASSSSSSSPGSSATAPQEDPQLDLTYAGTEASPEFLLAKRLLNDGDFDNAMETIGVAMSTTISRLPEDAEPQLHQSMAPLYYLYGTTLLYSIEESSDNIATSAATGGNPSDEEEADDSQIAWENLDVARLIVKDMLSSPEQAADGISLDLAQIHMRLGDLQRFNGRYHEAINDYMDCLEIRQPILGAYHRKVAELHHLLGVCYTCLVAEGDKQQEGNPPVPDEAAATPRMTPEQIEVFRNKSVEHYVATAKSFAGHIAFLCGSSPEDATADASLEEEQGGGKTTGMDPKELAVYASSRTVRAIRARVAAFQPPQDHVETVEEYLELLDDLQETIDESENAKKGMKEVASIKAQLIAEAEGEAEAVNADGSTTSIGFAAAQFPTASVSMAASVPGAEASAAAPTMMVRKKKKRGADEDDSKMPAQDDTKRAKTDE